MAEKSIYEKIEATGDQLVARVKKLIHEGSIRRLMIRDREGNKLVDIPLTAGIVGAILLPGYAALGAIAAMATGLYSLVQSSTAITGNERRVAKALGATETGLEFFQYQISQAVKNTGTALTPTNSKDWMSSPR